MNLARLLSSLLFVLLTCQDTTFINLSLPWITNTKSIQSDPGLSYFCFLSIHRLCPLICCSESGFYLIRYFTHSPTSELMISEMLPKPFWNSKYIMSVFPRSLWILYLRKIQSLISVWPIPYKTKLAISNKLKLLKLFPH